MSIAASNLFTRNLWGEFASKALTPQQEASMSKLGIFLGEVTLAFTKRA